MRTPHLERIDYPRAGFRFEHQQFQEYYAALMLGTLLTELKSTGHREAFGQTYLNKPAWDEPLSMMAEEIGATNGKTALASNVEVGSILVENALRVDPLFAARLAFLCRSAVSTPIRHELGQRLRSLYGAENLHYRRIALAAMLATGSDDFADILIPLFTNSDEQIRLATYRAGPDFHPSSLGVQWMQIVAGWQEEMRGEFISELAIHHGKSEAALTFARSDPSEVVRAEAIRALAWVGQSHEVAELLQAMGDSEFNRMLKRLDMDLLPPKLLLRAISGYQAILAETTDPKSRLPLAITLMRLGDRDSPQRLKEELIGLPSTAVKELSDYSLHPAIEAVRKADSQWVSRWVADRIVEGVLWRDSWLSLVAGLPESQREDLLRRVCSENLQSGLSGRIISLLAATADPPFAKRVFDKLRDQRRKLLEDPQNTGKQAIDQQLRNLSKSLPASCAVEGISDMLAKEPEDFEASLVTEMFSRMGLREETLRGGLRDTLRQQFRRYLKAAVPKVLDQR